MKKSELENMLSSKCEVTFVKLNGDTRKGIFKLNPDMIYNTDAVPVIELITGAYKAIKASSVISIKAV